MRFLCDEMLAGLGKWLRAAGYDTKIIDDREGDPEILDLAIRENRILLTRDRHFLKMNAEKNQVIFLSSNSIEDCAKELTERLDVDWLYKPLSRCLICNGLLEKPSEELILEHVPEDVQKWTTGFWYCHHCSKMYWEGAHVKKIMRKLNELKD
ncbi:MAG TPA: Mut7-C RNAse domain-containing protein [Rhabdochlamydiaceae bacterium]|nr:Mut7-C RNAse domain-containing protein [Rhabdochlamydiaceae bacterium]